MGIEHLPPMTAVHFIPISRGIPNFINFCWEWLVYCGVHHISLQTQGKKHVDLPSCLKWGLNFHSQVQQQSVSQALQLRHESLANSVQISSIVKRLCFDVLIRV